MRQCRNKFVMINLASLYSGLYKSATQFRVSTINPFPNGKF